MYASLQSSDSRETIIIRCLSVIRELGLWSVRNSAVGDANRRGLSGGQMKRLSIAKALMGPQCLYFLDEPTSGLSSTDSFLLLSYLHNISRKYCVAFVAVIHQPRQSAFHLFDSLLLLSAGVTVYAGPVSELGAHLARAGCPCPAQESLADWAIDVISQDSRHCNLNSLSNFYAMHSAQSIEVKILEHCIHSRVSSPSIRQLLVTTKNSSSPYLTSSCFQFRKLFNLFRLLATRDETEINQRIANALILSSLVGVMFYHEPGAPERLPVKTLSVIFLSMLCTCLSAIDLLPRFVNSRTLFRLDCSAGSYSAGPYFMAICLVYLLLSCASNIIFCGIVYKLTNLFPSMVHFLSYWMILQLNYLVVEGAMILVSVLSSTPETASASATFVLGYGSIFSGLLANPASLYSWMKPFLWVSPLWYTFEALCALQFVRGRDDPVDIAAANELFELYGVEPGRYWRDVMILGAAVVIIRVVGYVTLGFKAKF